MEDLAQQGSDLIDKYVTNREIVHSGRHVVPAGLRDALSFDSTRSDCTSSWWLVFAARNPS
jgi:hypothetical protein